jgi:hypothetical protein
MSSHWLPRNFLRLFRPEGAHETTQNAQVRCARLFTSRMKKTLSPLARGLKFLKSNKKVCKDEIEEVAFD